VALGAAVALTEHDLIAALRRGDPDAFALLVDRHSPAMIRVALAYVPSHGAAEEVVQETWIAVIRGLDRFEGRSALKTWIFRILTNVAMRSGARERRSVPFSALAEAEHTGEPSIDPDRFLPADHARFPGHWAIMPTRWPTPEEGLLAGETRGVIAAAVAELPAAQRTVISLRDIEGWTSEEVGEALEITPGNQRVLLHRARSHVRRAIERYYGAVEDVTAQSMSDTGERDA
jgi:RNA polymerase sigma-70 factor, ECF subfamily